MHSPSEPGFPAQPGRPLKRKIAAILAADIAGYSRLVAENEERTLGELAACRDIFDRLVGGADGRIFNTAGDSIMCEFDSAVEAVRVAVEIQRAIAGRASGIDPAQRLLFRMGITIGDVVERDGDLLGDGVNLAARLEGIAPPGGICASRSVREAVGNKIAARFNDVGERRLKNIPDPVHAYVIDPPAIPAGPAMAAASAQTIVPERRVPASRVREAGRMAPPFVVGLICGAVALAGTSAWTMRDKIMGMMSPDPHRAELAGTRPAAIPVEIAKAPAPGESAKPADATKAARSGQTAPARATPAGPPSRTATQTAGADKPTVADPVVSSKVEAPPASRPPAAAEARPVIVPVAEAAASFAALAKEGPVAEPHSLAEWYHNARLLEDKGDRAGALRAYAALAPVAGDAVDPLLRYAALLRGKGGSLEAARTTFADLARKAPSRAVTLVAATQAPLAERRPQLEGFVAANPDVAPANELLAQDYLSRPGGPTLTERRLAFDQFDRFMAAENRSAFFADPSVADEWVQTARKGRAEIEAFFAGAATRPRASFTRSDTGWIAKLVMPEPATSLAVRIGEQGEFAATGSFGQPDAATGRAPPNMSVELPGGTGRTTLYVAYRDLSGREAGPFPIPFDPALALVSSQRETLERYPESWVSFRTDLPDLLSFAQLVANRCAIAKASIGYGGEPPRQALKLPACSEAAGAADAARALLTLPDGTDSVQVQLAYADGTESEVRTYRRP